MSHEALAAGTELLRMGHLRWIGWKLWCAATGLNQNLRERAIFAGVFHTCAICRCRMHWYLLAYCAVIFWYILYKYYQNTAPRFSIQFTYSLTMVWWFFQIHSFPGRSHVHGGDDTMCIRQQIKRHRITVLVHRNCLKSGLSLVQAPEYRKEKSYQNKFHQLVKVKFRRIPGFCSCIFLMDARKGLLTLGITLQLFGILGSFALFRKNVQPGWPVRKLRSAFSSQLVYCVLEAWCWCYCNAG